MNGRELFKDKELQDSFNRNGYVKVPLLNAEEVAYFSKLFEELYPDPPKEGFTSGSYSPDLQLKLRASQEIKEHFTPAFDRYFKNYTPFGGAFLFKPPSKNSALAVHQDWTIVDEECQIALNCWVPLCDTDLKNGTLMVLPGANYSNIKAHRAPTLPFFFKGNEKLVIDSMIAIEAKAGEAVILDQSLVHYSPPNYSDKTRVAITAGVKTQGAPMRFYYYNDKEHNGQIDLYDMKEDFLIMFDNFMEDIFKAPKHGQKVDTVAYTAPVLSREELKSFLKELPDSRFVDPDMTITEEEPANEAPDNILSRLSTKMKAWLS